MTAGPVSGGAAAGTASWPMTDAAIAARTDSYFNRTKAIAARFGDCRVTYAVFLRRPVISAPRLAVDWLERVAAARGTRFEIEVMHEEGRWVGAGDPIFYLSGSFVQLADLETLYLQKLGPPCVAAHNAYQMCVELPRVPFLAMEAGANRGAGRRLPSQRHRSAAVQQQ